MSVIGPADVAVGIITYKRPEQLRTLLDSLLAQQLECGFSIVVVDNDPDGTALSVVRSFEGACAYLLEPEPGIVAARNRVLAELPLGARAVAFVDDDEWVAEGWVDALVGCLNQYGCDVVLGPVESVFDVGAPRWIVRGGFVQRPSRTTGTVLKHAATNNVLIRLSALRDLDEPRFDESFSMTGGSDAELFRRMREAGADIRWCQEAAVYEPVEPERATFAWILRRTVRLGNVSGRLMLRERHRATVACLGVVRLLLGMARVTLAMVMGRGFRSVDFDHFGKGIGTVGAALDRNVVEYRRST